MIKDFKNGERITKTWYELVFDDGHWNGLCFPCDKDGNLLTTNEAALENYEWARQHPEKYKRFAEIIERETTYREENSGICNCGKRIELFNQYLGGCECPYCGQWWNVWGQELNNPSTWSDGDDW